MAVLSPGKCSYGAKDGEIRLTALHSPAWSHHKTPSRGALELLPLGSAPVEVKPREIRTLVFPLGGGGPVRGASLLEE